MSPGRADWLARLMEYRDYCRGLLGKQGSTRNAIINSRVHPNPDLRIVRVNHIRSRQTKLKGVSHDREDGGRSRSDNSWKRHRQSQCRELPGAKMKLATVPLHGAMDPFDVLETIAPALV